MSTSSASGFLLLLIPDTILSAPGIAPQLGALSLECVTITLGVRSPERDVWLVLKHSTTSFELVIPATQKILHSRANNTYTFPVGEKEVQVTLPRATSPSAQEDLATFEVVLSQYGVLHTIDAEPSKSDQDSKGRLVLVDEDDGQIVGTLDEDFHLTEDRNLLAPGREKDPVVIEIPEEPSNHEVHVTAVGSEEEEDFLIKSAHVISRGIVLAASTLSSGMNSAANYYVSHAAPAEKPIVFSESTRGRIRTVHKLSGKAVEVTGKTTSLIHSAIEKLTDRITGAKTPSHPSAAYAPGVLTPPPLPPRDGKRSSSPVPVDPKPGSLAPPPPMLSHNSSPISHPAMSPTPPPLPPRKPRFLNRVLLSTDLLLTAVERSAHMLIGSATSSMSTAMGHKYGKDMGDAVHMVGDTTRNVGIVYIDARGVGRRALLKTAGKRMIKGKVGKKDVIFSGPEVRQAGARNYFRSPSPVPQPREAYPSGSRNENSQSQYSLAPSTSAPPHYQREWEEGGSSNSKPGYTPYVSKK